MNLRLLAVTTLVSLSLYLPASSAWAQDPGPEATSSPLPRQGRPVKQRPKYDPSKVKTVSGQVALVSASARGPVRLRLGTERSAMTILLCPQQFLATHRFQIALGDTLEVTGFVTQVRGRDTMLAGQLKKGSQVLQLRGADGSPLWGGQGQGRRPRKGRPTGQPTGQPAGPSPGNPTLPGGTPDPVR